MNENPAHLIMGLDIFRTKGIQEDRKDASSKQENRHREEG